MSAYLSDATMSNDAFWSLVGVFLIVLGNIYCERTLEFGGKMNAFISLAAYIGGWLLFLQYDLTPARPIGIIIPFIGVAIYIYTAWITGQPLSRIVSLRFVTVLLALMYVAAWIAYIYFRTLGQPVRIGILNVTGLMFILMGMISAYYSTPRKYNAMTIIGAQEEAEVTYYGTTTFTPTLVFTTIGFAFLAVNQTIMNFLS